jgi:predicted transcriptional regulator of viral defense system
MAAKGISQASRAFVAQLNRAFPGPFTPAEAAAATHLDRPRAARLLRQLASRGWVARLRRGLYINVPLEATDPAAWSADPWAAAAAAFGPGYIGGWTALHHWDLTDQVFATTVFVTTRPVPRRQSAVGTVRLELRHRSESALFGTRRVWRDGTPVPISDRERTLIDCLDDPTLGGGLRHTAEALAAYAEGEGVDWPRMVDYGDRLGNRTVFKRLGHLVESLDIADEELIEACLERVSSGIGRLDPALPDTGPSSSRWGLRINTGVSR